MDNILLRNPTTKEIIENLVEFCSKIAPTYWSHDELVNKKMWQVLYPIYHELSTVIIKSTPQPTDAIWNKLREEKWVLINHDIPPEFVRASELFYDLPATYPGYLYKPSKELSSFNRYCYL